MANAMQVNAIVPAANAPFQQPEIADDLRQRSIRVLPDPLVNAGAVIADSIERFSPEAWDQASAQEVYDFVRHEVRQRATDFLKQRGDGLTVSDALVEVAAHTGKDPIGLSFGTAA
jgi:leucine dehydrogenase